MIDDYNMILILLDPSGLHITNLNQVEKYIADNQNKLTSIQKIYLSEKMDEWYQIYFNELNNLLKYININYILTIDKNISIISNLINITTSIVDKYDLFVSMIKYYCPINLYHIIESNNKLDVKKDSKRETTNVSSEIEGNNICVKCGVNVNLNSYDKSNKFYIDLYNKYHTTFNSLYISSSNNLNIKSIQTSEMNIYDEINNITDSEKYIKNYFNFSNIEYNNYINTMKSIYQYMIPDIKTILNVDDEIYNKDYLFIINAIVYIDKNNINKFLINSYNIYTEHITYY
jgi:hypothetical protein